ncbi:baseplate J/gp47 family protein [Pseudomonas sp. UBA1879]|uniref:baseplate J/gp47 family protein n=1 Tax=Pseudomonas sp. UBA1879 TaxID=1947305 RepID=UPI0025F37AE2|nr:baseplate J/gp47 family protein [Pseudomonas sp. UBA1879]
MTDLNFKEILADSGIPTTDAALRAAWEAEVVTQGAKVANTSAYSPFWRVMTALVTKPVLWLLTFVSDTVLPNFFVKTAGGTWLDTLAWAVNVTRKGASQAVGVIEFTRTGASGTLQVPIGTVVQSTPINGNVYQLTTTADATFADGQTTVRAPVIALEAGSGYNLAPGYFAVLPTPIAGVVAVHNPEDWLATPGADDEPDDELRLRVRNQFSAVNQWHTDAVYRALIAAFQGVSPDGVFFQHGAPRGPGSANAYVLFEAGVPADTYLEQINARIMDEGNHGHGDDMKVFVMPETQHAVALSVWPVANLTAKQRADLQADIEMFIRSAFRESTGRDYSPTLTWPQSRFSFSRLTEELHAQFAGIDSLKFVNDDIVSDLTIPRLQAVEVTLQ